MMVYNVELCGEHYSYLVWYAMEILFHLGKSLAMNDVVEAHATATDFLWGI